MNTFNRLIFFILIYSITLVAQENTRVKVEKNTIILNVNPSPAISSDTVQNKFTVKNYFEFTNPSSGDIYKLPSMHLIVAIPPNSKPVFKVISSEDTVLLNTVPVLNPSLERLNDSTLTLRANNNYQANSLKKSNAIQVEKYFWYRDFYCAQIKINTYEFDADNNSITIKKNLKISVEFPGNYNFSDSSPIKIKSDFDRDLTGIIYDSDIAEQFRTSPQQTLADTTGNWIIYNNSYLKIGTVKNGIYRITYDDLTGQGINISTIDPKTFQLFESGKEQTIYVYGESDGVFNNGDYIEFFGKKNYTGKHRIINSDDQDYNEYLNRYTDTTYYFLTWGSTRGKRAFVQSNFNYGLTDTLGYYTSTMHFEKNSSYQNLNNDETLNQTPDWKKNKSWYWDWLITTRTSNVNLTDIYPNKDAKIYYKLVSAGSNVPTKSHNVVMTLNGVKIDSQVVDRFRQALLSGTVNSSQLKNGQNQIGLKNYDNGTTLNILAVDWYEIAYPRNINLINDSLYFEFNDESLTSAERVVKVGNVLSTLDIVCKVKPTFKIITNYLPVNGGLFFTDTVKNGDAYCVYRTDKYITPFFYGYKKFTNLRQNNVQADYIAITNSKFKDAAQQYITEIGSMYNVKPVLFLVDDIYDEFSYGYPDPVSIKLFLERSFANWQAPKPSYLMLIGDANYDYKHYRFINEGVVGGGNYVPAYGDPVSDNWYVVWDPNAPPLPQLKVGRLPINSASELTHYLSKVENNYNMENSEWNKRYLFFSGGNGNDQSELANLKSANDAIISKYIEPRPIAGNYIHFYKTTNPQSDLGPYTQEEINQGISQGGVFISYIGHSGTSTWDNGINNIEQLANSINKNPLITDFGCSTNKFAEPDIVSFGEHFVLDDAGQALGYLGNSSLGFTSTATSVSTYFYEALLSSSSEEIGSAHLAAKAKMLSQLGTTGTYYVFALTNSLLGDPTVELKIPKKPDLNISSSDFFQNVSTGTEDSTKISFVVNNFGAAPLENFNIRVKDTYDNVAILDSSFTTVIPTFKDTISVWLKSKGHAGIHTVSVTLDPENAIDELNEDNNSASFDFNIYSLALRDLIPQSVESPALTSLNVLNPAFYTSNQFNIILQVSTSQGFSGTPLEFNSSSGIFNSSFTLSGLQSNKRYWFRYKINSGADSFSEPKSFFNATGEKFLVSDNVAFNNQQKINTRYSSNALIVSNDTTTISVLSAGYYAGATCVISKNGKNLLVNNFFAGMAIAVFDASTIALEYANSYQLFGQPNTVKALANYINAIPAGKLVVMGVADDATNNMSTDLRNAIKTLGSTKIDSLQFRGSWALIGIKGAASGSVIEKVKGAYDGSVLLTNSYSGLADSGIVITQKIGPAKSWNKFVVTQNAPSNSSITYRPIGIKLNGKSDTLSYLTMQNNSADLSGIDAKAYPYLMMEADLHPSSDNTSPSLTKLGVDYQGAPELGTNYQVVSLSQDSVYQGDLIGIDYKVVNAGESSADQVNVVLNLIKSDNTKRALFDTTISSLGVASEKSFHYTYKSNGNDGYGNAAFEIQIDPENSIAEYYKDNNLFRMPFYIQRDTNTTSVNERTTTVLYDGEKLYDGDYVSSDPTITVEINYPVWFPVSDSTSLLFKLDGNRISDSQFNDINNDTSNKKLTITYKPVLAPGVHALSISGKDRNGNIDTESNYFESFKVADKAELKLVYNYPNPFSNDTYFTFNLAQIPDEMKIKIFTVAGRLIREIHGTAAELGLKVNFNRIHWDGRDEDGNSIANGVYLYKIIMKKDSETETQIQKLSIVR